MIAVLQRVSRAGVSVDGVQTGSVGAGFLILLGVAKEDTEQDAGRLSEKIAALRVFEDENGKMNRSVVQIGGGALVVSNFTLLADYSHGNRPDFMGAAPPDKAKALYERFIDLLGEHIPVQSGVFGTDMDVFIENDGPVTIVMDSEKLRK